MVKTDYKAVLEQAKKDLISAQGELGECLKAQEAIEANIFGLRQTIVALSKMLGEEFVEEDSLGLTDAVRQAFKAKNGQNLTPVEVRGIMEGMGYDISRYGNFMASVHAVINRLAARGEIRQAGTKGGGDKPAYTWALPVPGDLAKRFREATERLERAKK